jgi:hypothetical protein
MLTIVGIQTKEVRMKKNIIIAILLIVSAHLHSQKIVTISIDNPYTFSIASPLKRDPITVHEQNKAYLKLYCKSKKSLKKLFLHQCTIRAQEGAPEGTFALFRNTIEDDYKHLFHITIE